MLYLLVERFVGGDPVPVYRRLREQGRGMPDGLTYVASWVARDLGSCYQVVECADRAVLDGGWTIGRTWSRSRRWM